MINSSIYWSVLAGGCTVLGAVLLFIRKRWGNRSLAFFLGLASGVMVAVVIFDMLPSALLFSGCLKAGVGFLLGLLMLALVNFTLFNKINSNPTLTSLGYLIMLGIALHDLPEGMAIAFGEEMKARTGMVIALGIGIHNIPEGMAMAAPLLMSGVKKSHVLLKIFLVGLITPLGTILGRYLVSILPELLPLMLGLASGVMIYLVLFQLWPRAGARHKRSRWWGFWLGLLVILWASFV